MSHLGQDGSLPDSKQEKWSLFRYLQVLMSGNCVRQLPFCTEQFQILKLYSPIYSVIQLYSNL